MPLRVIGAGFGRTGTMSLKLALERLGFGKCHHMREVPGSSRQLEAWHTLSRGGSVDWDHVFEGFRATCDWPSSAYWEQLCRHYPDSKVILTVRDEARWYESVRDTIYPASTQLPLWFTWIVPRLQRLQEMIVATVWDGVFDGRFEDRAHALEVYRENSARVKRTVDPNRLLVFDAKDGWKPLCEFLDVPLPEEPYPHANEAAVIKRFVVVMRVMRWLPLILLGVLLAVIAL